MSRNQTLVKNAFPLLSRKEGRATVNLERGARAYNDISKDSKHFKEWE